MGVETPNSGELGEEQGGRTDEFAAIGRLRAQFERAARSRFVDGEIPPLGAIWIGDDSAVVPGFDADGASPVLLATDLVVEGVHVDLELCSLDDVGYKSLMVTVSDLAAMGARPDYALVSIAAPPATDLDRLGAGLAVASAETGCVVVGGDLSASPVLVISTAVFGGLEGESTVGPLLRSGAEPGDHLFVTGALGGSAAGLRLLGGSSVARSGRDLARAGAAGAGAEGIDGTTQHLLSAYRRPVARVREGQVARRAGAKAAIDISDGLVADARHLARASGVGMALRDVPVVGGATDREGLVGGEEYELLIATDRPDRLVEAFAAAGLRPLLPVGVCTPGEAEDTLDGDPLPAGGWQHRF